MQLLDELPMMYLACLVGHVVFACKQTSFRVPSRRILRNRGRALHYILRRVPLWAFSSPFCSILYSLTLSSDLPSRRFCPPRLFDDLARLASSETAPCTAASLRDPTAVMLRRGPVPLCVSLLAVGSNAVRTIQVYQEAPRPSLGRSIRGPCVVVGSSG